MLTSKVTTLLCASAFCAILPASLTWAQSKEMGCGEQEALLGQSYKCDDSAVERIPEIDPSVTNSVKSDNNAGVSTNDDSDTDSSINNTPASSIEGGGSDDAGDHDKGHGNDPDHDDPDNPGVGGGNHGTGNNGGGKGNGRN